MSIVPFERGARLLLALVLSGAATSELTQATVVVEGLAAMGYPLWILWLIAPAKVAAIASLVLLGGTAWARAAYLGIVLNLYGAIGSFLLSGVHPFPDIVAAPAILALAVGSAALHHRRFARGGNEIVRNKTYQEAR